MIRPHSAQFFRALFMFSVLFVASVAAVDEAKIRERIAALDSESFAERQRAAAALIEIGGTAVPFLRVVKKDGSAEQRARVAQLIGTINGRRLEREFGALGKMGEGEIEVERGMVLIAQILDPEVTRESIDAQFDAMAVAVRKEMGEGGVSAKQSAIDLITILRDEFKLQGDHVTYDHPDNSSVHRTLVQKDGLPIVLSEIAVAVGRRAGIAISGLPVPGQYMFKIEGGEGEDDVIIDPHGGWELREHLRGFVVPEELLAQVTARDTLVRMLNNLESDFFEVGDRRRASMVAKYRGLIEKE